MHEISFHVISYLHSIADLKAMVIEEVTSKDPFVLKVREKMYIKRFKTYEKGLNKEPWHIHVYTSDSIFF